MVSFEKGVLRYLAKITGKHLSGSIFFNNVARPTVCNFITKKTMAPSKGVSLSVLGNSSEHLGLEMRVSSLFQPLISHCKNKIRN